MMKISTNPEKIKSMFIKKMNQIPNKSIKNLCARKNNNESILK